MSMHRLPDPSSDDFLVDICMGVDQLWGPSRSCLMVADIGVTPWGVGGSGILGHLPLI